MRRRGFTLLELMTAVAIISAMSALAVINLSQIARVGRTNGEVGALARLIGASRVRAVTQQCPHYTLINGPQYAAAGVPIALPSRIYVVRKGNCGSVVQDYEAGDQVVDTYPLDRIESVPPQSSIIITPSAVLPGPLVTGSIMIGYDRLGTRFTAQTTTGPPYTAVPVAGAITFGLSPHDPQISRTVTVPLAGTPTPD